MTRLQRFREVVSAVVVILIALLIMLSPAEGYEDVIYILAGIFVIRGLAKVIYYFSMARFMVGGRWSLYTGIIMFDLGILTATLTDVPHYYILIYLIAMHAFTGAVEVLRAREAARFHSGSWKLKMGHGILDIVLALVCIIFIRKMSVAVEIYCYGILYSSIIRIISAFRKSKFVYIQ